MQGHDPQRHAPPHMWVTHNDLVFIEDLEDEHLLNAYKTCVRFDNPKADDLLDEIEYRHLAYRLRTKESK